MISKPNQPIRTQQVWTVKIKYNKMGNQVPRKSVNVAWIKKEMWHAFTTCQCVEIAVLQFRAKTNQENKN